MNYTTVNQAKRLTKLGLNPNTSDMSYRKWKKGNKYVWEPQLISYKDMMRPDEDGAVFYESLLLPCWSLGTLLEIMPICNLYDERTERHPNDWSFNYNGDTMVDYYETRANSIIEAAYNMVVWLLENNYINKKEDNH